MDDHPNKSTGKPVAAAKLFELVRNYGDRLATYLDGETGELHDPYETRYGEGYGPGLAAHIFAGLYRRFGDERYLGAARLAMGRVFDKLARPTDNTPFTDIFLYFWSLKAYELLEDFCPPKDLDVWRETFVASDYRFSPPNTNGHCLLAGTSLVYAGLGFEQIDVDALEGQVRAVGGMQNDLGFIDDAMRKHTGPVESYRRGPRSVIDKIRYRFGFESAAERDLKPIAYHSFCCAVLAEALRLSKRIDMPGLEGPLRRITEIVNEGIGWIDRFTAADGSVSMTERSRDQFWTGMSYAYLLAMRGTPESYVAMRGLLDWWLRFIKEDGTCSVTPNYFSNGLRVGFEHYSIMSMYVSLGFCYLLDIALEMTEERVSPKLDDAALRDDGLWVDRESGYAHLRRGASSVGISLRRHHGGFFGGYCPAMGIFNVVIGGGRSRPLPAPCYRWKGLGVALSTRRSDMTNHGVYEGLRAYRRSRSWGLDFTSNADIFERDARIVMTGKRRGLHVEKIISLDDTSIEIVYVVKSSRAIDRLLLTWPVLLSDGRNETELRFRGPVVEMTLGGERFRLACMEGHDWVHHQERHLLSTSGITSQLYVVLGRNVRPGVRLGCTVRFERMGGSI